MGFAYYVVSKLVAKVTSSHRRPSLPTGVSIGVYFYPSQNSGYKPIIMATLENLRI